MDIELLNVDLLLGLDFSSWSIMWLLEVSERLLDLVNITYILLVELQLLVAVLGLVFSGLLDDVRAISNHLITEVSI